MLSQAAHVVRRRTFCRDCSSLPVFNTLPSPIAGSSRLGLLPQARYNSTFTLSRRPFDGRRRQGSGSNGFLKGKKEESLIPSYRPRTRSTLYAEQFRPALLPSAWYIVRMLLTRLPEFSQSERFRAKLDDYGIDPRLQSKLVHQWRTDVQTQLGQATDESTAKSVLAAAGWDMENLQQALAGEASGSMATVEAVFSRKFVVFSSTHSLVPPALQAHLRALLDATDLTMLAFRGDNVGARAMTRHFHLHIGPTNSGKTYNALKALSQAETGAYAGPLRLLAHEVWERLNLGSVGGLDGEGKKCNLITGEERRIVDQDAGLISCTVEMLPLSGPEGGFDVVVIDEIQMIGDPQRGGAWTAAVLGVRAKEVHLCGDETTIELLSELIPSLGDKMTVHRYERLTPLTIAEKSLDGDLSRVQPGDCVVTFSRNNIYSVKKMIESTAAKKCAVVYGALPPETRADQARDFNDENGRCEVLVASDAVGMGLNLKINRIIFESLEKFNGKNDVPLALTQIKQIAGRAGRFGMQRRRDDAELDPARPDEVAQPGGEVTTLHKTDLPILREVLPMPLPMIHRAVTDIPFRTVQELAVLLPPNAPFADVLDHLQHLVVFPPNSTAGDFDHKFPVADVVEAFKSKLSLFEVDLFTYAPVNLRDPNVHNVFTNIIGRYAVHGLVPIDDVFEGTRFLSMLDLVEATLATLPPLPPIIGIGRKVLTPPIIVSSIPNLESMHKSLVMYIWLSFRLEVAFPDRPRAVKLKERVEKVLDDCLARFPGLRQLKTHERTKQGDRAVADWRKANVAPNGTRKIEGSPSKGIKWVEEAVIQRLRNKEIWKSTGVVPHDRILAEADGRGRSGTLMIDAPEDTRKWLDREEDKIESERAKRELQDLMEQAAAEEEEAGRVGQTRQ